MKRKLFILSNIFLSLIFASISVSSAAAESSKFGMIVNSGVPQGKSNNCLLRDKYGFLWIGTTSGICCYDGNYNSVINSWPGVLDGTERKNINTIFEHGNDIWFGDLDGLYVFDRKNNISKPFSYKTKYGVSISSTVQKICDVGNGTIWILTYGQGIFILDEKSHTLVQNSRNGIFYYDMVIGSDGRVYTVCMDGTVNVFNTAGGFVNSFVLPQYAADKRMIRLASIGNEIWISAHNKLFRYDIENRLVACLHQDKSYSQINCVSPTNDSKILLGTDSGVWLYDIPGNRISDKIIDDYDVAQITYDNDSSIVVLSRFGGLSYILPTPNDFLKLDFSNESDSDERITDMRLSSDNKGVWLGTESGVSYYDISDKTIRHDVMPVKDRVNVTNMAVTEGRIYVGTINNGVILWDLNTNDVEEFAYNDNTPYAVISNNIKNIYHTSNDEYYVLTGWGVCKFDPKKKTFTTIGEIDNHIPFIAIEEDRAGRVWLVTASNIIYMKEHASHQFRPFSSTVIDKTPVRLSHLDTNGTLWLISQDNDIFSFDEGQDDFVKLDVVLPKDSPVSNVFNDRDGNLWLGGSYGLAKLTPDHHLAYFTYPAAANANSYTMAACPLPDGRILFGCDENLWLFDPNKINPDSQKARSYVQSISFPYAESNGNEIKDLGLDKLLYLTDEIKIPYSHNSFTLHLSASRGNSMPDVRYNYKLEGVDEGWIDDAGSETTYTNLSPGKYTFLLKPSFGSDLDTQRLTIIVLPPWYRSWWAYTIYAVLFVLALYVTGMLFRNRIRRHYNQRMETLKHQQERESYESKMKFFIDLVHEIRTPLTLISLPLEKMADDLNQGKFQIEDSKKHITSVRRNVNYLLGIISQLLEFHKAENNKEVHLVPESRNINRFISEIVGRFEHPMEAAGRSITLHTSQGEVIASIDAGKIDRVMMNIIGNAVKYCRTGIEVALTETADGLFQITVSDDGPGIPFDDCEKIFDSFYQVNNDNVAGSLGTGMGLAYAKMIVRAHGGDIKAENNSNGGASFTITLPLATAGMSETPTETMPSPEVRAAGSDTCRQHELSVLLIDDNVELLNTIKGLLSENYNIITAENADEALKKLDSGIEVDFIISDFMMPGMSGAELCRKVKQDVRFSHIPFIILTAKTNSEAKEEGMECGADVYIEKPFTIKQITLQLANMIKTREQFYSRISSGDISAESATQEAPFINQVDTEFIETLNDYIREKILVEEFSIDELATLMNMSRSTFYRKLKSVTGLSPNDYLKNFRLDYAARLLVAGLRVTEAGERAGFTSSSYFAKCFKARFGMSPKEYVNSKTSNNNSSNPV